MRAGEGWSWMTAPKSKDCSLLTTVIRKLNSNCLLAANPGGWLSTRSAYRKQLRQNHQEADQRFVRKCNHSWHEGSRRSSSDSSASHHSKLSQPFVGVYGHNIFDMESAIRSPSGPCEALLTAR